MFGLPSIEAIGIVGLIAFGVGATSGMIVVHKLDLSKYQKLELSYKEAQIKALEAAREEQKKLDNIALDAAKREAATQAALTARAKQQLSEVSRYVKNTPNNCITYGLVRVLDAAVRSGDASSLALPAGKSNDSCSGIDSVTLARSIIDNYNTANANKEQLNSLVGTLRTMRDTQSTKKK
jgi:hypothetical protein